MPVLLAAVVGLIVIAIPIVREIMSHVETENAYITGHVHAVSTRIAGTVTQVLAKDNQQVKAGQLLLVLDDRDQVIAVRKAAAHLKKLRDDVDVSSKTVSFAASNASAADKTAQAAIVTATNNVAKEEQVVREALVGISMAKELLAQRDAELRKAALDLQRLDALEKAGAVATETLDTARRDNDVAVAAKRAATEALEQARSRAQQANSELRAAKAQYDTAKASSLQAQAAGDQVSVSANQRKSSQDAVDEAQVELDNAQLQLSYTRVYAPIDGRIGRKSVEVGQRVQPGTPLMAVVSNDKWIIANLKETQLRDIKIGQRVDITVDSFGARVFSGRVESFSPASGAAFALLPPDNATGNFTKIVQRIPVKIVFEPESLGPYRDRLTPGMSCIVKIKVQ
jgi:membrane fusion protein (multidrug efflux system)